MAGSTTNRHTMSGIASFLNPMYQLPVGEPALAPGHESGQPSAGAGGDNPQEPLQTTLGLALPQHHR